MSVQLKILAACLGFVLIIAMVGGLAQQQAAQMGHLAIDIYDHAFMGMSYIDQAQQTFLRLQASQQAAGTTLVDGAELKKVLTLLDVALDRAVSDRSREAGKQTRALLTTLGDPSAPDLSVRMKQADQSLTKLVKKFAADGLETRDSAEELTSRSTRLVLIQIAVAIGLALGVGFLVGRSLSRPLVLLVRSIDQLAAGELEHEIPSRLARRRDEIGAVARAAAVFREAMQQNAKIGEEHEKARLQNEEEKREALRDAADSIERETSTVAEKSASSGAILASRAHDLAASAARMLDSVASATGASSDALQSCQVVAAAGEELSESAQEIASQIATSTREVASTARAGEQAHKIIDQLSGSMNRISDVATLIGGIAGRTNLLALNASIEAARAGDAGRGFAVVANEVKALAMQTAKSTEEIAQAVSSVQATTRDAVKIVVEMVRRVASIEQITQAIAAAAELQTLATGKIARSVLGTVEAMRIVSGQIGAVAEEARGTDAAVNEMQAVAGTVTEHITELRKVMIRVVRTSSDAANRREDERFEINAPGILVVDGDDVPVMCLNLSLGGARVRARRTLLADASVILRLPGLPDLAGKVLRGGAEVSLRFAWNEDAAPQRLCDWLATKVAA